MISLRRRRREQERRNPSENKSPAHDTCSIRALFQERPRKFKRHHSVQCSMCEYMYICVYIYVNIQVRI